ncbi:hypothetical protein JXA88_04400, partial [Candidatus Fermentibacteria bacterium]|nr:hypothetical protein [Candidatus Fermentibacteria bacterium]
SATQFREVFGQVWEGSSDSGVKRISAAVGLLQHDPRVARLETENTALRERMEALEASNTRLEARLATLEESR